MRWRHGAVGVALATAAFAVVLFLHALLAPPFRASDEPQHLSTSVRLATGGGYPAPGTAVVDEAVAAAYPYVGFPGLRSLHAGDPLGARPPGLSSPTLNELRAPGLPRETDQPDQMTQHPPGYYLALAGAIRLLRLADLPVAEALLALRLLSAVVLLPLPWLCWRLALLLGLPPSAGVASAWVPLAWPQLAVTGATLNNGTPLVVCGAALAVLLVPVVRGDLGARRAAGIGAVLSAALLTKGFALGFCGTVAFAYLAGRRHDPGRAGRAVAIATACAAPGFAWWAANVVRFGTVQPAGAETDGSGSPLGFGTWAWRVLRALVYSWWEVLGWLEHAPPLGWAIGLSALALGLVALGTWRLRTMPAELVVLHSLWLLPLGVVLYGALGAWLQVGQVRGVQGRYLQTGAVTLCVLVVAALAGPGRAVLAAVPPVATALAGLGLSRALDWFWLRPDPALPESWWPVPTGTTAVSAALLLLLGAAGAVQASIPRAAGRPSTPVPTTRGRP